MAYSFTPTVASSTTHSFSISNKPAWATFSIATGTLTGTPASAGTYSNITISVSNASHTATLTPFSIAVSAAPAKAAAPVVSAPVLGGTPAASVVAGATYSFVPTASDPNGLTLSFSITGMPAWASFNSTTGALSGTPTSAQLGSYAGIVISTSDGHATTSLPAFTVTVTGAASGSATLSWTPPTQNSDGTALTDLAGYNLYYGTSAGTLSNKIALANAGLTAYTLASLSTGTYYFALTAYNSAGAESALSNVGSKSVP